MYAIDGLEDTPDTLIWISETGVHQAILAPAADPSASPAPSSRSSGDPEASPSADPSPEN